MQRHSKLSRSLKHLLLVGTMLVVGPAAIAQPQAGNIPPVDETMSPYASTEDSVRLPDGRMLHFVCMGEGSPTVILSAGMGESSATAWSRVQADMAKITRVCPWDRPGFGLSDGSAAPVDVSTIADDLAAALTSGTLPGPYVMVGHSLGSYETLLFTDRHPDQVVGMVLVDPSIPQQTKLWQQLEPDLPAPNDAQDPMVRIFRNCAAAIRAGTAKPEGPDPDRCFALPPMWPIALRQALTAKMADPVQYETMASFIANSASASDQVVNSSRNYRDMPLIVLSAGDRLQAPPGAPPPPPLTEAQMARQAAREAVFDRGQAELAELSTNGVNLRVPGANHHIQLSQPQAVIDAVAEVVEKVRASGR